MNVLKINKQARFLLILSVFVLLAYNFAYAQTAQVREAVRKTAAGRIDEAKKIYAELKQTSKDDPGVLLLEGILLEDAYKAFSIYQRLVKDFPKSEWADDAYWRIVQFYAIKGDTANANASLETFRKKYPASEFLSPASDVVRASYTFAKSMNKKNISESKKEVKSESASKIDTVMLSSKKDTVKAVSEKEKKNDIKKKTFYALQIGVFSTIEAAQTEEKRMVTFRLKSKIVEKDIDGVKMFAVIIGNYPTLEIAEREKVEVESKCGCKTIIYTHK